MGGGFETSLLINNTQPQQISVQVVVYDHAGRRIPAQAVELGPLASVDVDLGTLIGGRIGGYGQIALQHQGQTLDVAAQVIIRNRRRQLVFNQGLLLPGQHAGNHLVGVSDLGVSPASSLLAISNAGTQTRRVTVEAVLGNHRGSETLDVGARRTWMLPLSRLFGSAGQRETAFGIQVRHDGGRGDVMVHGLLMSVDGLAANLRLTEPAKLRSRRALSPALRLSSRQRPRLALYNFGSRSLAVTPTIQYRVADGVRQQRLSPVRLGPRSVLGRDLSRTLEALPAEARDLSLLLEHEEHRRIPVSELLIIDPGARSVVQATPKDTKGEGAVGMTFAWRLDGEAKTVIALANPSDTEEITFRAFLFYNDETYTWAGDNKLRPGEAKHIDIRQLRDEQIEDEGGGKIPLDVVAGQAKVFVHNKPGDAAQKLVGQAIQIGADGSLTAFLSCPFCPPGPSHVTLTPLSLSGNIGTSRPIYPWIHWDDGSASINGNPYAIDWDVADSDVATVSKAWYNFRVQFEGVGTTMIGATMSECRYDPPLYHFPSFGYYGGCSCETAQVSALQRATATTETPTLKCPRSATRGQRLTARVSNLGNAHIRWDFLDGNSVTVTKDGEASWSGVMVISGTIRATITPRSGPKVVKQCRVSVSNRSGWKFSAVSARKQPNGYTCSPGTVLSVPSPPTGKNDAHGMYCLDQSFDFMTAAVRGGPNDAYKYVTSINNSDTKFSWVISPALENTTSQFYQAQCGNYPTATGAGFISGANLKRNTIRHESGSVQSHYASYKAAQSKSANNLGTVGEQAVMRPTVSEESFIDMTETQLDQKLANIMRDTGAEPYNVNLNASGVFQGPGNYLPYTVCPQ